ncbi:MAG: adenine phosphoribosyltransferase [Actinomycetota bacterium]|nr:adenine phosphoribosyltransferase [Actinomycetota bacterium]
MKERFDLKSLKSLVADFQDFPQPGVTFRDISPVLAEPEAFAATIEAMVSNFQHSSVTRVAGIESRGFLFGPSIAAILGVGFCPIRKAGKLPGETITEKYGLEYGSDTLEMSVDAISSGDSVLLVDDVLATGGTLAAATRLVRTAGAVVVGATVFIELDSLKGREQLGALNVAAVIHY